MLFVAVYSCKQEQKEASIELSHIADSPTIIRYDQELFGFRDHNVLKNKYPQFTDLYFSDILPLDSTEIQKNIEAFVGDTTILKIKDLVDDRFSDFKSIEDKLIHSSKLLKHYFPDIKMPRYYTFISEFAYQVFIFDDHDTDGIGIGLDLFLGESFPYKSLDPSNAAFSDYVTRTFNKDHIVKKALEVKISEMTYDPQAKRLIDKAISSGKRLFILDKLLPSVHDSILIEYTGEQLDWSYNNEKEMWSYFLDNELLYESKHKKINKYLIPAPHSAGMPPKAPGRTAEFIGWQIVKAYMARNPNKSLTDLVNTVDYQSIFQASKYKPTRK